MTPNMMRRLPAKALYRTARFLVDHGFYRFASKFSALTLALDDSRAEFWMTDAERLRGLQRFEAALEALMAANARSPRDRRIALLIGLTLDELEMCEEAYHWLCRAAHAAGEAKSPIRDGETDGRFWKELGVFCLSHDRFEEAKELAAIAILTSPEGAV